MQLLVIRHAIAVGRKEFALTGKNDDLRPLTADGRRKMRQIAAALRRMVRPNLLATSPLTRARQTAEILAIGYDMDIGASIDCLRPDAPFPAFARWASEQGSSRTIAIVGHDPHLSGLVSWLMSGAKAPSVALEKGGACFLTFDRPVRRAGATLDWLLLPAQLRQIAPARQSHPRHVR